MQKRQPNPGWTEFRRCVTKTNKDNDHRDKLVIRGIRFISTQEYEEM